MHAVYNAVGRRDQLVVEGERSQFKEGLVRFFRTDDRDTGFPAFTAFPSPHIPPTPDLISSHMLSQGYSI
jgi:hypothetical protein